MRVLIVHDYGTLNGGAELMSMTLRDGLRERGHDAKWFTSSAKPLPLPVVSDHQCWGSTGVAHHVTQALNPLAPGPLRRTLREFRPDVVHCRMFMTQLSPLILPLFRDIPSVLHVVNHNYICPINTKRLPDGSPCHDPPGRACMKNGCLGPMGLARTLVQYRLWDRWRGVFDRIITNSHWTRQRLEAEGVEVSGVIHNGVPVRDARPPLSDPPTVGYAGRLIQKKGVDLLVRAMRPVVDRHPDARLVVCGDGPEMQPLQALAAELGVAGSIDWKGHLSRADMEAALSACWVQVAPSRWEEPFGLVGAEAGMRGTAAIVSDSGGLAEIIERGVTGYTFPNNDPAALADRLLAVLGDRDHAEALGAAGRDRVMQHFTEAVVVERFIDLYREMLGEAAKPQAVA